MPGKRGNTDHGTKNGIAMLRAPHLYMGVHMQLGPRKEREPESRTPTPQGAPKRGPRSRGPKMGSPTRGSMVDSGGCHPPRELVTARRTDSPLGTRA